MTDSKTNNNNTNSNTNNNVLVIGCGIIGLTASVTLQQQGYNVTIVSDIIPPSNSVHYTSVHAGL